MKKERRKSKKRVNITIDLDLLEKAKSKLNLFGGKLSTLFNAYLSDFVSSMQTSPVKVHEELNKRIDELEKRIRKLEEKI